MNINLELIKSHIEDLIKVIEDAQNKAKKHPLTKQEFLQFLEEVKEKNSFITEELDISVENYL